MPARELLEHVSDNETFAVTCNDQAAIACNSVQFHTKNMSSWILVVLYNSCVHISWDCDDDVDYSGGKGPVAVVFLNCVFEWSAGEGEFGIVHKAMWHGTLVAAKILKVSNAIALGDFRSELEVLRKVHHPNAVQFLGACTRQEPYVLVTELMTGGSLADAMRLQQPFTVRRAMEICIDTARGLAYMHNKKPSAIIHRDLKPGNLMISGSQYHSMYELLTPGLRPIYSQPEF